MLSQSPLFSTATAGSTPQDSVVFQGLTPTLVPVTVEGATGQTADLFDVVNSLGQIQFGVGPTGNIFIAGNITAVISEVLTGNLSLTGNLLVSGTATTNGLHTVSSLLNTGTSTFNGAASFLSPVSLNGGLAVSGTTNLSGSLNVIGSSLLTNSSTSAVATSPTISVQNTSVSGWSEIGFVDNAGAARFQLGYANASASSLTSTAFLNISTASTFQLTLGGSNVVSLTATQGNMTFSPIASSSGNHTAFTFTPPANTGGSTTVEHSQFIFSSSTQTNAAGLVALWRYARFDGPKFDFATSSTATVVANVGIGMVGANSNNAIFGTVYGVRIDPTSSQSSAITASFVYAPIGVAAGTLTLNGTTEITSNDISALRLDVLTITDSSSITVDSAATMTIVGPPVAAGSVTLTNAYAINVKAGAVRFAGDGTQVFYLPTDNTANAAAQVGRIPINIGGVVKYLYYYGS